MKPLASVIICTKNRYSELRGCLDSIYYQTFQDFEVVVVVDVGTMDKTFDLLKEYDCLVVNRASRSQASSMCGARNDGIEVASGQVIAFIDDDCVADRNWLYHIVSSYSSDDTGGVGGKVIPVVGPHSDPELLSPIQEIPMARKILQTMLGENSELVGRVLRSGLVTENFELARAPTFVDHLKGGNMSFRKELLERIGGFDEQFKDQSQREETDVCLRIRAMGYKLLYNPAAKVWHKQSLKARTSSYKERYDYYLNNMFFLGRHKNILDVWKFFLREFLSTGYIFYRLLSRRDGSCLYGLMGKLEGFCRFFLFQKKQ